jgi:hypothetical protein
MSVGYSDLSKVKIPLVTAAVLLAEGIALFFFIDDGVKAKIKNAPPSTQTVALVQQSIELKDKDMEFIKEKLNSIDKKVEANHSNIMDLYKNK